MKKLLIIGLLLILAVVMLIDREKGLEGQTERLDNELIYTMGDSIIPITGITLGTRKLAEISAYNNHPSQTWGNPNITASGRRVREGIVACPAWLEFGTQVEIEGKMYICEDRMNIRYRHGNYFDIFTFSYQEAIEFGRQKTEVIIY